MGKVSEKPICLINQPSGLGDILFLQKAAAELSKEYNIIWPVLPQLEYVKDYLTSCDIQWVRYGAPQRYDKSVDFSTADRHFPGSWQHAKYKLINLDWSDWAKDLKIKRNLKKEADLKQLLNLPAKYLLYSKKYGTLPHCAVKDFSIDSELEQIELREIDGFTLFDWCGVIEGAQEIWSVDSSLFYIIETLNLKADKFFCFPRSGHTLHIDGLFKIPWIFP